MLPDTVGDLPIHPLLVHGVVVLVPLSALGAVVIALVHRWTRPYGLLVALGAAGGAVLAFLAKTEGDQFEVFLNPQGRAAELVTEHGQRGLYAMWGAIPFGVLAVVAAVLIYRNASTTAQRISTAVSAIAGIVALVLVVLAGHSGSAAVWTA